jgi:hypothetical protein
MEAKDHVLRTPSNKQINQKDLIRLIPAKEGALEERKKKKERKKRKEKKNLPQGGW